MESPEDTASSDVGPSQQDTSGTVAVDTSRGDKPAESAGAGTRRRVAPIRWLAAVVLVAVLAGAGYGGWVLVQHHQRDVAAAQALDAAKKYVQVLTNFNSDSDAPTIDGNMDFLLDGATGDFKDMYARSRGSLLKVQVAKNAAARGTIEDAVVKSATKNTVVLMLFVDQSVTNTDDPDPEIDRARLRMTMEKVDGRWLVSKLELP